MRFDMMTIVTKASAAYPTSPAGRNWIQHQRQMRSSRQEFAATMRVAERVANSLRQERALPVQASLDAPENEASLQQVSIPPALSSPVKIDLAALSDVPLGTPVQEIDRAAEAFGLDASFMKTVAKIESDLNPRERTGSYVGLFQLSKSEFRRYGSGDILNPRDNAMAAARKFISGGCAIRRNHAQEADVRRPLSDPSAGACKEPPNTSATPSRLPGNRFAQPTKAWRRATRWCKRAVWGNTLPAVKRQYSSVDRLTSGAFVAMWRNRIDMLLSRYAAPAPQRPEA